MDTELIPQTPQFYTESQKTTPYCNTFQDRDSNLGLQVLQTLLTHTDIQVSVTDEDKRQPLLWAASAGSAKAVLALVRAGASVEAADKDGLTALHCAASRGHTDCLDTLLTLCGASTDVIDSNGCTALHYAVTLGESMSVHRVPVDWFYYRV